MENVSYKVRKPTEKELKELKELIEQKYESETAEFLTENYFYVVIEDYYSDCPGYCGKLLFAVYGIPEFYQLYGWVNGELREFYHDGSSEKDI